MLSTTTEYALRAMVALARETGKASVLGRDLSEASGVPGNYLAKILLDLNRAGIVSSSRGTGGGYSCRRPPSEVRLMEVVRVFEPDRVDPGCLLSAGRSCSDEDPCAAHEKWRDVRAAFVDFLESTTIADLAEKESDRPA